MIRMNDTPAKLTYTEAQSKIQFEHTLISHRMSWLFTAHVFLFAAFFALSSIPKGDARASIFAEYKTIVMAVGTIVSLAVFISVAAAHFAMAAWIDSTEDEKKKYLVSKQWTHSFGEFSSSSISLVFIFVWVDLIALSNLQNFDARNVHVTLAFVYMASFILYHSFIVWRKIRQLEFAKATSLPDGGQGASRG